MIGVAVKITEVPGQIAPPGFAAIVTDGVRLEFTAIVIELDVAVAGDAQVALDVMITFTISPLANAVVV